MMKLENLSKLMRQGASCISRILKKYYFYCFVCLLLLAALAAGLVYYFYVLKVALPPNEEPVKVNFELFNKILRQQEDRQANLQREAEQNYPDIFR